MPNGERSPIRTGGPIVSAAAKQGVSQFQAGQSRLREAAVAQEGAARRQGVTEASAGIRGGLEQAQQQQQFEASLEQRKVEAEADKRYKKADLELARLTREDTERWMKIRHEATTRKDYWSVQFQIAEAQRQAQKDVMYHEAEMEAFDIIREQEKRQIKTKEEQIVEIEQNAEDSRAIRTAMEESGGDMEEIGRDITKDKWQIWRDEYPERTEKAIAAGEIDYSPAPGNYALQKWDEHISAAPGEMDVEAASSSYASFEKGFVEGKFVEEDLIAIESSLLQMEEYIASVQAEIDVDKTGKERKDVTITVHGDVKESRIFAAARDGAPEIWPEGYRPPLEKRYGGILRSALGAMPTVKGLTKREATVSVNTGWLQEELSTARDAHRAVKRNMDTLEGSKAKVASTDESIGKMAKRVRGTYEGSSAAQAVIDEVKAAGGDVDAAAANARRRFIEIQKKNAEILQGSQKFLDELSRALKMAEAANKPSLESTMSAGERPR